MFTLVNEGSPRSAGAALFPVTGAGYVANKLIIVFTDTIAVRIRPTIQYARDCKYRSSKFTDHGKNN